MKNRTFLLGFLLFFTLSAAAQQTNSASLLEPMRGRLVPTFKRDTIDSYRRDLSWQPLAGKKERYQAEGAVPFAWNNRQVLLRVAGAPAGYTLWVNDKYAAEVTTGALPAEFNLTKQLRPGDSFRLELRLKSTDEPLARLEDFDHPEQVLASELISQPTIRVRDVLVSTRRVDEDFLGEVGIVVKCDALNEKEARIHYELVDTAGVVVKRGSGDLRLRMRGEDTLRFVLQVPQHLLWSPDSPLHYRLRLSTQTAGRYTEYLNLPIAFRQVALNDAELMLNGRPFDARAYVLKSHPTIEQLQTLKEQGYRLLLPLPGYSTEELYALADEVGLCVVAQAPICTQRSGTSRSRGANPSNDPQMTSEYLFRTASALHLARRHPSVVGYALAHESANGIALYESYLALKRLEQKLPILYFGADGEWNSDSTAWVNGR